MALKDGPPVWVDMMVDGDDLRAAFPVGQSCWRATLGERLMEPAFAALCRAAGHAELGEPTAYRIKLSLEPADGK